MKNNLIVILSLLSLITSLSCCRDPELPPQPPEVKKLEILWRSPLVPDPESQYTLSNDPFLIDSTVVVNITYDKGGDVSPLLFFNSKTGALEKQWSDYIDGPRLYVQESIAQEGNYLLMNTMSSIDCINLKTAQTAWNSLLPGNGPYIYTHQGYVYNAREYNNSRSNDILRSPVGSKNYEVVYSFTEDNGFEPVFDAMGFTQLPGGDEILLWKNRSYKQGERYLTEIFAYNLSADSLLWRNPGFRYNGTVVPLQSDGKHVFGVVRNHAFCIDLLSGSTLWIENINKLIQPEFSMEFFSGAMYLEDDYLILGGNSPEIVAINKIDGSLKYVNRSISGLRARAFRYFEGKLFFSSGELQIIDVRTGEALISNPFNSEIDDIQSKIVIDPSRRVMYFHNYRELFCARIPEDL